MTTIVTSRKAQLSFDMAFALILMMIVLSMVVSYQNNVEASLNVVNGRALMGLNVIADYTIGDLNAFYNSLIQIQPSNATHVLNMTDSYLFSDSGNKYELNYTVKNLGSAMVRFEDMSDASVFVERKAGYLISCSAGSVPPKSPGTTITLTECKISGKNIACVNCA